MKTRLLALLLLLSSSILAQTNALIIKSSTYKFDSLVSDALDTISVKYPNDSIEDGITNSFMRWATFWNKRVSNDATVGNNTLIPYSNALYTFMNNQGLYCSSDPNDYKGDWKAVGPFRDYFGVGENIGRVDAVWADYDNPDTLLAGSNAGGLWKSVDGGQHWTNLTDYAGSIVPGTIGVNNIAVDSFNKKLIYLSLYNEGSYKKADAYGQGLVYSTDGGHTWQADNVFNGSSGRISRRVIKIAYMPGTEKLFALIGDKDHAQLFYKSGPGYGSWDDITPGAVYSNGHYLTDFEFTKASRGKIVLSTDAVSNVSHLYVIDANNLLAGATDLQISIPNFTQQAAVQYPFLTLSGILDFSINGSDQAVMHMAADTNGQRRELIIKTPLTSVSLTFLNRGDGANGSYPGGGIYNIEVSPQNSNVVYALNTSGSPGDNVFRSTNEGFSFSPIGSSCHADGRTLFVYSSTNSTNAVDDVLFGGTDGGIIKKPSGSSQFGSITGEGLNITEFYSLSNTEMDEDMIVGGSQDNETWSYIKDRTQPWAQQMLCDNFIDKFAKTETTAYTERWCFYLPNVDRLDYTGTTTAEVSLTNPNDDCTGQNLRFAGCYNLQRPLYFNDNNMAHIGVHTIWKKPVFSGSWVQAFNSQPKDVLNDLSKKIVADFAIAESDSNVVYIAYRDLLFDGNTNTNNVQTGRLYVSTNAYGTATWQNITPPSVQWSRIDDIEIDHAHPNRIWVALGNVLENDANNPNFDPNSTTSRVFYSDNYGLSNSWVDISKGLPPMPVSKVLYLQGSDTTLFAGTDAGVFKWSNALQKWICFNDGMPPCIVTDMEFNYCAGKLRVSTFGRGIWETKLGKYVDHPGTTNIITTNTTWSEDKVIYGNIEIKPGARLTINGGATVHMPKNAYIIVDSNAYLNVRHATLTNSCDSCLWGGIKIGGNQQRDQSFVPGNGLYAYQGWANLDSATIEHAIMGVENINVNGKFSGGVAKVTRSRFINNRQSVFLHDYITPLSISFFTTDTFERDGNYKENIDLGSHLKLYGIGRMDIQYCVFYNHNGSRWGKGVGVFASEAAAFVNHCQFRGFYSGVHVDEAWMTFEDRINSSNFDSCTFGIRALKPTGGMISMIDDTFKIGNGLDTWIGQSCYLNVGIYTTTSPFFQIYQNNFQGVTTGTQSAGHKNWGALVENSNTIENPTIYKNIFNSLDHGLLAWGYNNYQRVQLHGTPGSIRGVSVVCNTFTSNSIDMTVDTVTPYRTTLGILSQGICINQGVDDLGNNYRYSAGNLFGSTSTKHIYNSADKFTYYYWNATDPNPTKIQDVFAPTPPHGWTGTVALRQALHDNDCPNWIHGGGSSTSIAIANLSGYKNDFASARSDFMSVSGTYDSYIDGGSTSSLLSYLVGKTMDDSAAVYSTLAGYSPFLSDTVLLGVANANILSTGQLIKLLEGNPELAKRDGLQYNLMNLIPNPLTETDYGQVMDSVADSLSDRGRMESEMQYMQTRMDHDVMDIIAIMENSCNSSYNDTIPKWYDTLQTVSAEYAKIGFLTKIGDFAGAEAAMTNIPTKFTLSPGEATEHTARAALWSLYKTVHDDGRSLTEITEDEVDDITTIQNTVPSYTPAWAGAGIGRLFPNVPITDPPHIFVLPCSAYYISGPKGGNTSPPTKPNRKLADNDITAYPNPARDFVTFEYRVADNLSKLILSVTDVTGREVKRFSLDNNTGKVQWNTRSMQSGIYIYKLLDGRSTVKVGRVVITK